MEFTVYVLADALISNVLSVFLQTEICGVIRSLRPLNHGQPEAVFMPWVGFKSFIQSTRTIILKYLGIPNYYFKGKMH
jgi:hypothetical protein